MSKRFGFVLSLVLTATFVQPPSVASGSNQATTICDATSEWISIPLPAGLLELVCTIVEQGDPVGVELNENGFSVDEDNHETLAQDTNLPADTDQPLSLWLRLLSVLLGQR